MIWARRPDISPVLSWSVVDDSPWMPSAEVKQYQTSLRRLFIVQLHKATHIVVSELDLNELTCRHHCL